MNYSTLISKLPEVMRQENNLKFMKSVSKLLDSMDLYLDSISKIHVIDYAVDKDLDAIGDYLGIARNGKSDSSYKRLLKIYYYTYYFVPNANNFLFLIKNIIGYMPEQMIEGWLLPINPESCSASLDIVIPVGDDDSFLVDLDKIFSAGCRLDWRKLQEAYAVNNLTSKDTFTGVDTIYEEISAVRIGSKKGYSAILSTRESNLTGVDTPMDIII